MMFRLLPLFLLCPLPAWGITLTVGPSQSYTTISDALAVAVAGDIIEVEAGNYNETVTITVDVTITGLSGSGSTSISAGGADTVVVNNATATLSGFTLLPGAEHGLNIRNNANLTSDDLVVSGFNSYSNDGSGARIANATVHFTNCVFENNYNDDDGGAIDTDLSDLTLDDCVFRGNHADDGGGGLRIQSSTLTISNSLFEDNTNDASGGGATNGGAIHLDTGSAVVTNTDFIDNATVADGAAVWLEANSTFDCDTCLFDTNIANNGFGDDHGGAIGAEGGLVTLSQSTFVFNDTLQDGGAVWADGATLTITSTDFTSNTAGLNGGAIYLANGSYASISDSTFDGNGVAGGNGGAILAQGNSGLTLDNSSFDANIAAFGGAVYARDAVGITGCTFDGNSATSSGGAVRWRPDDGDDPLFSITDSTFTLNDAAASGGAIGMLITGTNHGYVELFDNVFTGNDATVGGAISSAGTRTFEARRNVVCGNSAGAEGGGLFVDQVNGATVLTNNFLIDNDAGTDGGGAHLANLVFATVQHNNFVGGSAAGTGGGLRMVAADNDFRSNIVAFVGGGDGISADTNLGTRDYNLWFGNTSADAADGLGAGDLGGNAQYGDPLFTAYSADGDCANDDFTPLGGSPVIDNGDPAGVDIDGSPPDIGALGGDQASNDPYLDIDGDGYDRTTDCDDGDPLVNPGAAEVCDGIDNNCDGGVDDYLATGATDWYRDDDGDGFGNDYLLITACYAPPNFVADGGDCNDQNPNVNPDAVEICDGLDNDCNDQVDDGLIETWYVDADGDGYGDDASAIEACEDPGDRVTQGGDCDDSDDQRSPGLEEICDDIDNDCDEDVDEDLFATWYEDSDGDAYGNPDVAIEACEPPVDHVLDNTDCDDTDADVNPGNDDPTKDGIDQDCSGRDGPKHAEEGLLVDSGCSGCNGTGSSGSGALGLALAVLFARRRRDPTDAR